MYNWGYNPTYNWGNPYKAVGIHSFTPSQPKVSLCKLEAFVSQHETHKNALTQRVHVGI